MDSPYTKEWSIQNMDRLARELVEAIDLWADTRHEAPHASRKAYYEVLNIARAMQMHLGNILQIDYQEYARAR